MFPRNIRARGFAALGIVLILAGCGSDDASPGHSPPPPPPAATAPSITAQPTSASVSAGQSATFDVGVAGTAPLTYQWRRDGVDIAGATGASYTTPAVAMSDNGFAYTVVITNSTGTVTSTAAVLTVTPAAGVTASIEVGQSASLLTAVGQSALLAARPVDGQGVPVAGRVTWETSNPAAVSVDAVGRITAQTIGSAMLFATANGVRSQPIFVLVAEPQPGALILEDSQVVTVGTPTNLAPGEPPGVGTRYDVTVSGLANAPAPGTVVLAAGDAAVAGKVVATRADAANFVLTIEVAALPDLLARYEIDWDIDLSAVPVDPIEISAMDVSKTGMRKAQPMVLSRPEIECDRELNAGLATTSISLTPQLAAHFEVHSHRSDPSLPPGYSKLALVGSQSLIGTASMKFSPGFDGLITCVAQTTVKLRVTGIASVLVMPALRIGVGFSAGGEFKIAEGELKAEGTIGLRETLGFECTSAGCAALKDVTPIDDFKLTKTVPSLHQMQVDITGQFFALAGIDAAFFLGLAEAEIIEARIGPKQTFELMFPDDQAHNPGAASKYHLDMDGLIGPGSALRAALKKFIGDDSVSLNFDIPYSRPIATSPKGSFDLSSNSVAYGQPVAFQVVLDQQSLTYPFIGESFESAYNVKNVQIWRRKADEPEFEPWRTLPASAGRATFQDEWTPTSDDTGDYEFAAFVETELPVPLVEVAEDSKRALHVRGPGWAGNVTFTLEGSETTTDTFNNGDSGSTTVETHTDSGSGTYRLETLPGQEGLPILSIGQASGTMTRSVVTISDSHGMSNGCQVTNHQIRERVEQGSLRSLEGVFVAFTFLGDGTYQLMIPNLVGSSSGSDHVEATGTASGGPQCHDPAPTNQTTTFEGSLGTAILSVTGVGVETARSLSGTATVQIDGLPDQKYTVSWSLQR